MTKPKRTAVVDVVEIESTIHAVEGADVVEPSDTEADSEEQTPEFDLPTLPAEPGPHALDLAPVNSKIVVVRLSGEANFAVLATPDGASRLPAGDPAHALPEGARIRKVASDRFEAEQMSPVESRKVFTTPTAGDAISGFVAWFHGPDADGSKALPAIPEVTE